MENGEGAEQLRRGVSCHAHHRWMNRCHYHPRFADEEGEARACAPGGTPRPYVACPQSLSRARSRTESTKPGVIDSRPCSPRHAEPHLPRFILCWPFGASFGKMLTLSFRMDWCGNFSLWRNPQGPSLSGDFGFAMLVNFVNLVYEITYISRLPGLCACCACVHVSVLSPSVYKCRENLQFFAPGPPVFSMRCKFPLFCVDTLSGLSVLTKALQKLRFTFISNHIPRLLV